MSTSTSIPLEAQSAKTVPQMLSAVKMLADSDTVQAIPHLARIDRSSPGWLTAILIGGVRIGLGLLILYLMLIGSFWLLVSLNQGVTEFIQFSWSDIWIFDTENVESVITRQEIFSSPVSTKAISIFWLAIVIVDGVILIRSKDLRFEIYKRSLWPEEDPVHQLLRIPLTIVERISQVIAIIIVGYFVALSLLPLAMLLLEIIKIMIGWLDDMELILDILGEFWRSIILACIIFGVGFYYLRRLGRRKFDRFLVIFFGVIGLINLIGLAYYYGIPNELWIVFMILSLVYPAGIAIPISRISFWPFVIFRNGLHWAYQRIILRWQTAKELRHHEQRNKVKIENDIWVTVCKDNLVRFVPRSEKISYFRRIRFGLCPICENDNELFNGVECIALIFETNMTNNATHLNSTLYVNGLNWTQGSEKEEIPVFDTIVVRHVENHDLEAFITKYENKATLPDYKPLEKLDVRIAKGSNLGINELNLLKSKTNKVFPNYDDQIEPIPCVGNLRMKETLERGSRRFRQVTLKLVKIGLAAIIITGITIGSLYFIERFSPQSVEWPNDLLQYAIDNFNRYTQNW